MSSLRRSVKAQRLPPTFYELAASVGSPPESVLASAMPYPPARPEEVTSMTTSVARRLVGGLHGDRVQAEGRVDRLAKSLERLVEAEAAPAVRSPHVRR
jgi:hypothetical protein